MRKKAIFPACGLLILALGFAASAYGQNFPNRVTAPLGRSEDGKSDDIQSMYMNQQWSPGIIQFKSSRPVMQVPVIFDADNDKLYYLENNMIMEFVDSVSQFMMKLVRNGDSTFVTFRNAYPAFEANTAATFYEVMVDGNIQLLKCRAKSIYLFKEPDVLEKKKPAHKELLFAYMPGGKMVTLKKDIDVVVEKMPDYAQRIREIEKDHKLKVKSEKKLCELFAYLNKPKL